MNEIIISILRSGTPLIYVTLAGVIAQRAGVWNLGLEGLMIIGGYGTGKTSIIKTFHQMILFSFSNGIQVRDIEGTIQFLNRYKLGFGFYTANDVVKSFEGISNPEEKEIFKTLGEVAQIESKNRSRDKK